MGKTINFYFNILHKLPNMLNEEMPTKYPEFEDIDALSGSQEEASAFEGEEGEEGYEDEEGVE